MLPSKIAVIVVSESATDIQILQKIAKLKLIIEEEKKRKARKITLFKILWSF